MQIEAGKCYRTRDGRKVGPMTRLKAKEYTPEWKWTDGLNGIPSISGCVWRGNGTECANKFNQSERDLIAEWVEADATPAPLPYGHARLPDGSEVDLTDNREAHGLMDPDKRAAMEGYGEEYQYYDSVHDAWLLISKPHWSGGTVYRVRPKPAAPREGWVAVLHLSARDCKIAHPGAEPLFVRVVEDGE